MTNAPKNLPVDAKAIIKEITVKAFPNEAWGFLVNKRGGRTGVYHGINVASEPTKRFRSRAQDWIEAEEMGKLALVWHSHPNGRAELTMADKVNAESNELPMLVYAYPADLWAYYEPCGYQAPLEGRPFVHGILDCYATIRDYFRARVNTLLPDFNRVDDWWLPLKELPGGEIKRTAQAGTVLEPPQNLYEDNMHLAGFRRFDGPLRRHDCILMRWNHNEPIAHAAVYLGDNKILHHPPHRQSKVCAFHPGSRDGYDAFTEYFVRHESLFLPEDYEASTVLAKLPAPQTLILPNR